MRVYIVDDSTAVRNNLSQTLGELAQIEPAGTTDTEHEAKRWLAANDWDLAIIDLFLREGSGMNVLQGLRRSRPGQRIVVLSNHSSPDVRWRCRQLGADAVFDKSLEIEDLVAYCQALRASAEEGQAGAGMPLAACGAPGAQPAA